MMGGPSLLFERIKKKRNTSPLMLHSGGGGDSSLPLCRVSQTVSQSRPRAAPSVSAGAANPGPLGRSFAPSAATDAARSETLPGSSPHAHTLCGSLGPHLMTCHFDTGANISPLVIPHLLAPQEYKMQHVFCIPDHARRRAGFT